MSDDYGMRRQNLQDGGVNLTGEAGHAPRLFRQKLLLFFFVIIFFIGLVHLMQLRFEAGDIYPLYSSYRADPLGTKALHDSLSEMPGITVSRNLDPFLEFASSGGRSLVFIPALEMSMFYDIERQDAIILNDFIRSGNRLVIGFRPSDQGVFSSLNRYLPTETPTPSPESQEADSPVSENSDGDQEKNTSVDSAASSPASSLKIDDQKPAGSPADEADQKKSEKDGTVDKNAPQPGMKVKNPGLNRGDSQRTSLVHVWQVTPIVDVRSEPIESDDDRIATCTDLKERDGSPISMVWPAIVHFEELAPEWRVLCQRKNQPVIIERQFGKGTIVLMADSYPISNEALSRDRHTSLISYLIGSANHVIFEETHLGILEQPGVVSLMRSFRLHGLFVGLGILVVLFLWQNSRPLIPPYSERTEDDGGITGFERTSFSGFVNLIRRNVPRQEIMSVLISEWRKTQERESKNGDSREQTVQTMLESIPAAKLNEAAMIELYRSISRFLKKRR